MNLFGRATKGLGRTQPIKWKDAGKSLDNDELVGCEMPDGGGSDVATGGYLQYNEVRDTEIKFRETLIDNVFGTVHRIRYRSDTNEVSVNGKDVRVGYGLPQCSIGLVSVFSYALG